MGYFLAVSAFKIDPSAAEQAIIDYCTKHGVRCVRATAPAQNEETDAAIYQSLNGWTRVLWPAYYNIHDFPLCTSIAALHGIKVSTIHVYDGDYWEHLFLDGDQTLHKFSSRPDYFAESPDDAEKCKEEWRGQMSRLTAALGIPGQEIAGYMVHLPIGSPPPPTHAPEPAKRGWLRAIFGGAAGSRRGTAPRIQASRTARKAYPTDEFDIEDFWVFTDFWKKLGIIYPDPPDANVYQVLRIEQHGEGLPM